MFSRKTTLAIPSSLWNPEDRHVAFISVPDMLYPERVVLELRIFKRKPCSFVETTCIILLVFVLFFTSNDLRTCSEVTAYIALIQIWRGCAASVMRLQRPISVWVTLLSPTSCPIILLRCNFLCIFCYQFSLQTFWKLPMQIDQHGMIWMRGFERAANFKATYVRTAS